MLRDMGKRHQTEQKKTVEFLRYALGNRAPKPARNLMVNDSSTLMKSQTSMSISNKNGQQMTRDLSSSRLPNIGNTSMLSNNSQLGKKSQRTKFAQGSHSVMQARNQNRLVRG